MSSSHIVCPSCLAINRIPQEKLSANPNCGKCKKSLFMGQPVNLNDSNFERFIAKTDIPIVVDFWADWCGPCKTMAPFFTQATNELEHNYRFVKLNTELAQQTAAKYQIRSIPTLIIFKNGKIVAQQAGAMQKNLLIQWIQSL